VYAAIDVIIPTYGSWNLTASCLRHLDRQTIAHGVIVVDNGSPDKTPERVREYFPEVRVIELQANRGFAAACNAGIRASQARIVVLLNNDVEAHSAMIERMTAPFATDGRLGSVAPLLLRPDGFIDSVGLCADPTLAGFPRHQGRRTADAGQSQPLLLGPSGAAAAYLRDALDDVGLLDESIFMYQEDLDLALRLRANSWRATCAIDAQGVHLGSASAGRRSAWQRRQSGFSRGYLLRRYGVLRSWHAPRAIATELLGSLVDLALARDTASCRGRWSGWRAARSTERRRIPDEGIDKSIGMMKSLRLRRVDHLAARDQGVKAAC
jgi:GT2 family glycosyltransferase